MSRMITHSQYQSFGGAFGAGKLAGALVVAGCSAVAAQEAVVDSGQTLDPLVVTVSPFGGSVEEMISPVTVVGGEELDFLLRPTIGETLASQPGLSATSFGPGASRPIIRGLDRERVRILTGGLGSADVSATSEDHAVGIPTFFAEKIEVVRGPAALLYGSSAVGGVVKVTDRRIAEEPIGVPFEGSFESRYTGRNDGYGGGLMVRGEVGEGWNYYADGFWTDAGDLEIPGFALSPDLRSVDEPGSFGTLENSAVESWGFSAGLSKTWEGGFFGFSVSRFDTLYGVPGGHGHEEEEHEGEHEEEEEEVVRIDLDQTRVAMKGRFDFQSDWLQAARFEMQYSDYGHRELEGAETGTVFETEQIEGRVEFVQTERGNWEGVTGFQGLFSDFSAVGEEAFVPPSETVQLGLFSFQSVDLEPFRVEFGGRYEYQEVDGPVSRSFHALSGSAGFIWEPVDGYSAAINGTFTQRPASATELFADGPHLATGTFEVGDANLGEEEAVGIDLTLRKTEGRLTGSAGIFYQRFPEFFALNPTGAEEDGLPVFVYEAEEAEFYGAEAELRYQVWNQENCRLAFTLGGDVVRATNLDSDEALPRIPAMRALAGVEYGVGSWGARLEGVFAAEQDRVAPEESETGGYALINAELRYTMESAGWTAYVQANNLLDETVRHHTSFLKDVAPEAGRNLTVGFRTEF